MDSSIPTTRRRPRFAKINPMTSPYLETAPDRAEVDALPGATVLEFGTNWCGVCRGAQPAITEALGGQPIRHIKIEDGSGRKLGRTFGVKLWPTLIFLKEGVEMARVVRPREAQQVRDALSQLLHG
jgi:thioredoxin 1